MTAPDPAVEALANVLKPIMGSMFFKLPDIDFAIISDGILAAIRAGQVPGVGVESPTFIGATIGPSDQRVHYIPAPPEAE